MTYSGMGIGINRGAIAAPNGPSPRALLKELTSTDARRKPAKIMATAINPFDLNFMVQVYDAFASS